MPRAFITGVAGQDGSYLAERLLADGWEVHGLRPAAERRSTATLPDGVVVPPETLDTTPAPRALVADVGPDELYNLGGVSSVARSWEDPVETAQVNGVAAVALMDAAWRHQESHGPRRPRASRRPAPRSSGRPASSRRTSDTADPSGTPYGAAKAFAHQSARV